MKPLMTGKDVIVSLLFAAGIVGVFMLLSGEWPL